MSENAKPVAHANWKDADEFCKGAFGPFGVDTEPYTKIVAELMQHATDRALASRAPAQQPASPVTVHPLIGRLLNMARWQRENMDKLGQHARFNSFANGDLAQEAADALRDHAQCAPGLDGVSMAIEACAKVADRFLESDLSYAIKYPDEAQTFVNRSQRAKTIAYAIRALIKAKEGCA